MKCTLRAGIFICLVIWAGWLVNACQKNQPNPGPGTGNNGGSVKADTITNHLRFVQSVKKTGVAPRGTSNADLKISFKDTLFLVDEVMRPIQFLNMDKNTDVAGVYLQIFIGGSG